MEGRFAIRGCSQLELTTNVSGLWSLPDEVALDCLAPLSRLDLAALAIASKSHRSLGRSFELWKLRKKIGSAEPSLYVFLHMYPDPSPRWFILHPVQRRLRRVFSELHPAPESGSAFVMTYQGFFVIGGLMNGKPTSQVTFYCCVKHLVYRFPPMKMARSGASATLINDKIYVFGGCWDVADSSNWAEVFDVPTRTWDSLFAFTPKMPLKIQRSVERIVERNKKVVLAVDDDGENFIFSPAKSIFVATGKTDSCFEPQYRNEWFFIDTHLFCGGNRGRLMWCRPDELDWKEVKGLEALCGGNDICRLCDNDAGKIFIFWKVAETLKLWCAEVYVERRYYDSEPGVLEMWGKIEWCRAVLSLDSCLGDVNLLVAGFAHV